MKKTKTFLILANLVVGFGIYLSWENKKEDSYSLMNSLLSILSNMDKIEWYGSETNNSISIVKNDETWTLIEPYAWSANSLAISNFQTKFAHFYYDPLYELDALKKRGEILEDYGINQKSKQLTISGNNQVIKFWVGSPTRDGENVYALVHDTTVNEKILIKINNEIIKFIDINILDWTERNFIKTPLYAIEKLSVTFKTENNQTNETSLFRDDQSWNFNKPFNGKADAEKVMLYLNSLLSANITNFQISDEDKKTSTTAKWTAKLELNGFDKNEVFFFWISKKSDYTEVIGKSVNSKTTFALELDFMKNLNNWTTKLRSRTIFNFSSKQINKIEIVNEAKTICLSYAPSDEWNISESNQTNSYTMKADSDSIVSFLRILNTANIEQFLTYDIQEQDILKFKMNDPIFKIITKNNNSSENEYIFNRTSDEEKLWTIWDKNQSIICLVNEDFGKLLTINPLQFKAKKILPDDFIVNQVMINHYDTNQTISLSMLKNGSSFSIISDFLASDFIHDNYLDDGTWVEGDWVPWQYHISFLNKDGIETLEFRLSERKGATTWYAGDPETNLVFNLPIAIIEEIADLLILDKSIKN